MKHLDLFSGIGGFAIAAKEVFGKEYKTLAFCEIDKHCQKILRKNFGDVPIIDNIFNLKGAEYGPIDLLTGGFPCQPFSQVGKRKGRNDDRALFPQVLRIIKESKPRWIILENVYGIITIENGKYFEEVCSCLENEGYSVQTYIIPASAVNAPHQRNRVWFIAYSNFRRWRKRHLQFRSTKKANKEKTSSLPGRLLPGSLPWTDSKPIIKKNGNSGIIPYSESKSRLPNWNYDWPGVAHWFRGMDDGLSQRPHRLKSLGNAIVPQVAINILEVIKMMDN